MYCSTHFVHAVKHYILTVGDLFMRCGSEKRGLSELCPGFSNHPQIISFNHL